MSESAGIIDLLDRTYDGDAWHGSSLMAILKGVTAAQAARKPANVAHSIWELVAHIAQWEGVTLRRLEGEVVEYKLDTDDDWPPVSDTSEAAWKKTLAWLDENHRKLRAGILALGDTKLREKAPNRDFTNYIAAHGIIHHRVYHSGQIAVLKRQM
jgi:uncharacterized damage-inducible protein DinB